MNHPNTTNVMNVKVEVNSTEILYHGENLTSRALMLMEELCDNMVRNWSEFLKNGSDLQAFACENLYNFYAPHQYDEKYELPPEHLSIFDENEYHGERMPIIGSETLGKLPSGVLYDIIPYTQDVHINYHFYYPTIEDEMNREDLHVNVVFTT